MEKKRQFKLWVAGRWLGSPVSESDVTWLATVLNLDIERRGSAIEGVNRDGRKLLAVEENRRV